MSDLYRAPSRSPPWRSPVRPRISGPKTRRAKPGGFSPLPALLAQAEIVDERLVPGAVEISTLEIAVEAPDQRPQIAKSEARRLLSPARLTCAGRDRR